MKTIEISDDLADTLEGIKQDQITSILYEAADTFIDISSIDTPKGSKVLLHKLTGKKLYLAAFFEE